MVEKKTTDLDEVMIQVIRLLVDRPERVQIKTASTDSTTFYDILVDGGDVGTVIGPKGKHITAVRTVFMAAAAVKGQRIAVSVNPRTD